MASTALWAPTDEQVRATALQRFAESVGHGTSGYTELHRWSIEHLDEFWAAIWEFFGVQGSFDRVLGSRAMPGAEWFPDTAVNYARHVFARKDDAATAIWHASESRPPGSWTWARLRTETARIRCGLVAAGVGPGDRVAAYMPNIPETLAALLATASLGAIWTSAAPEFGPRTVIDRFAQIEPSVLLAVDGYRYGGKAFDRRAQVAAIHEQVGGRLVRFGYLDGGGWEDGFPGETEELAFADVPFSHPLWVLYSSGTTGLPKAIVHSQGGILLEQLKTVHLHFDARADDRVFWFTTTGWMMFNLLAGILLSDAAVVLYDGNPAGEVLWDLAADAGVTIFGGGASYFAGQMKQDIVPGRGRDLSRIRAVGSTGSPLSPGAFRWIYEQLGNDVWLFSTSGGTDVCSGLVGGVPTLPVYEGEIQAPMLGCAVESWDPDGRPLVGAVGELVVTQPMPSMPVCFWGDDDGSRYRESYFDMFPGVWRHGDWIELTERGGAIITGRSDSTINRGGVRIGTGEIYRAVLELDEIVDAIVVDVDDAIRLFVVLAAGVALDDALTERIAAHVRRSCSPRHVPDDVRQIGEVPRTLSGKALEVPVKRILAGTPVDAAVSADALANPAS
ncbi:MAG: acetoacetate--CoA ligase, partial [Solirubrobacteraceae bacterium]